MLNDLEAMPNMLNWAGLIRNELFSLGFNDVWYAQGVGNVNYVLKILKQRISDQFKQNWKERLDLSPVLYFILLLQILDFNHI